MQVFARTARIAAVHGTATVLVPCSTVAAPLLALAVLIAGAERALRQPWPGGHASHAAMVPAGATSRAATRTLIAQPLPTTRKHRP